MTETAVTSRPPLHSPISPALAAIHGDIGSYHSLFSSDLPGLIPRVDSRCISSTTSTRRGTRSTQPRLYDLALNLRWIADGFDVLARADVRILFPPWQKESPLGVPTQSAHPGTPPSLCGVLSCLRCNNMVSCWEERCSHRLTVV